MNSKQKSTGEIQLFIVDDHPVVRQALADRVSSTLGMSMCGECETSEEALQQVEALRPDVVVIDLSLQDTHGVDLIQTIKERWPEVQVVVYSMHDEVVYAERAIRAGAAGYVMKGEPTEQLISAIQAADEGDIYLSQDVESSILKRTAGGDGGVHFPIDELSDRELTVFRMLGEGQSVDEIADRLGIAGKTVEGHRRRAKQKLEAGSVSNLQQYAALWMLARGDGSGEQRAVFESLGEDSGQE